MRLSSLTLLAALGALVLSGTRAEAQGAGRDPVARLRAVLPADVAERVIATVTAARERGLPSQALENRALKYAAWRRPGTDRTFRDGARDADGSRAGGARRCAWRHAARRR